MIDEILPGTKTKLRVIKTIYRNPGINITGLVEKSGSSPNTAIKYVNSLVERGVIRETKRGGSGKPHIRELNPNFSSEPGKMIFSLLEVERRWRFLEKYRELAPVSSQMGKLFENTGVKFCLIYGSFARFSSDEGSDLDLLIVGDVGDEMKKNLSEIFVTIKREYSMQIEDFRAFLRKSGEPLHRNILENHVIVWGEFDFVRALSRISTNP